MAAGASGTPAGPTIPAHIRGRKKVAPNIKSEEDFPTLGGGPAPGQSDRWVVVQERLNEGKKLKP